MSLSECEIWGQIFRHLVAGAYVGSCGDVGCVGGGGAWSASQNLGRRRCYDQKLLSVSGCIQSSLDLYVTLLCGPVGGGVGATEGRSTLRKTLCRRNGSGVHCFRGSALA